MLVNVPGAQGTPVGEVEPGRHTLPAGAMHGPLQAGVDRPAAVPAVPAGHGTHARLSEENWPGAHGVPVANMDPAVQALPGVAMQGPSHVLELPPGAARNRPTGQSVQLVAPPRLYLPAGPGNRANGEKPCTLHTKYQVTSSTVRCRCDCERHMFMHQCTSTVTSTSIP